MQSKTAYRQSIPRKAAVIAIVSLSCAPLCAEGRPTGPLDGRWIYDSGRSRQLDPDLLIATTTRGTLRLEGGHFGGPYELDAQGGSHRQANGTTIVWHPISPGTWSFTRVRDGEIVESAEVTLRGDTLRTAMRGRLPDGLPYERIARWHRDGHARGLAGKWRSIAVDTGTTFDEFIISTAKDGVVTWQIPTDLQVITGRLNGSDLPIVGTRGTTGSTIALRRVAPGRFAYTMKEAGRITELGTITISPNGRWLTEWSWGADQPRRRSKLVYGRD